MADSNPLFQLPLQNHLKIVGDMTETFIQNSKQSPNYFQNQLGELTKESISKLLENQQKSNELLMLSVRAMELLTNQISELREENQELRCKVNKLHAERDKYRVKEDLMITLGNW